jgi:acylphosphatase
MKCVRCIVSGRVQGVFFRRSAQRKAEELGVIGWARNLPDGRVEVLLCGEEEVVEAMHEWLWEGPPSARVEEVLREEAELSGDLKGFEVR